MPDPRQLSMFDLGPPPPAESAPIAVDADKPAPPVSVAAHVSAARQVRALTLHLPIVADADPDPPGYDGWREYLGAERPRIVGGACTELARRHRPDGTLEPCAWTACSHHLAVDQGEVVDLGPVREAELVASTAGLPVEMGRRPSLSAIPETAGEVHDFADGVAARLDGRAPPLPYTCTLDVVREYPDGAPIEVVARATGISEEAVRLDLNRAVLKILMAGDAIDPEVARQVRSTRLASIDGAELTIRSDADPVETLERAAPNARVRRPVEPRRRQAEPPPVPRAIVRVEREAPPPREPSAEDLFTF